MGAPPASPCEAEVARCHVGACARTRGVAASTAQADTFGQTKPGALEDGGIFANFKVVHSATLSVSGSVTKLSVDAIPGRKPGSEALKAVIYSDSGGSPENLLATGTEVHYQGSVNGSGWFDLPFAAPVTLSPGKYWIGFITGGESERSVQIGPQIGGCTYDPWPGLNVSIQPGNKLILTQTGKIPRCTSSSIAESDNFDTSESFLVSPQYQQFLKTGKCENDKFVPEITLTINGTTTTLKDTGQVLNRGGIDPDICHGVNEAQNWVQIP
jgi:hypothetical protein